MHRVLAPRRLLTSLSRASRANLPVVLSCCQPQPQAALPHTQTTARFEHTAAHLEDNAAFDTAAFDRARLFAAYESRQIPESLLDDAPLKDGWSAVFPSEELEPINPQLNVPHTFVGYITSLRLAGKGVLFANLVDPSLSKSLQLIILRKPQPDENVAGNNESSDDHATETPVYNKAWHTLRHISPHTPVQVKGLIRFKEGGSEPHDQLDRYVGTVSHVGRFEISVEDVVPLNHVSKDMNVQNGMAFTPKDRHLQFKTDNHLRMRIKQRSRAMALSRKRMFLEGFDEIETPLLFKSTPEGAREFIVPTRTKGMAYALPQSPQQYKQVLMASGVPRYFQLAKCFRDEDLRSDRQPEFTQLDLEMAFATPADVQKLMSRVLSQTLAPAFGMIYPKPFRLPVKHGEMAYIRSPSDNPDVPEVSLPSIRYDQAIALYGSDKPDLRMIGHLWRIDTWITSTMQKMMSSLTDPIVEAFSLETICSPREARDFLEKFMDGPIGQIYSQHPNGMPGIAVLDESKPLNGLAAFGHEAVDNIMDKIKPRNGSIFVVLCRPPERVYSGSTPIGDLRRELFKAACKAGVVREPKRDMFYPLWVTGFPLFTPASAEDKSASGLCSTHHPFTSPVPSKINILKLQADPLAVDGDHFDLVINGIEVGGGSRRVHDADMQEHIFRNVLKLPEERINDFAHLLRALRSGCPPHTGMALGFDRLMTILTRTDSVRDVIAFPKTGSGEDAFVGAPSPMTEEQLETYHLSLRHPEEDVPTDVSSDAGITF